MKTITSCVVDSIERDLETQRKMDRMNPFIKAETVHIGLSEYVDAKVYHRGFRWYCAVEVSTDTDGFVVNSNTADISVYSEDKKKCVPHWGRVRETIRDTIAGYISNY